MIHYISVIEGFIIVEDKWAVEEKAYLSGHYQIDVLFTEDKTFEDLTNWAKPHIDEDAKVVGFIETSEYTVVKDGTSFIAARSYATSIELPHQISVYNVLKKSGSVEQMLWAIPYDNEAMLAFQAEHNPEVIENPEYFVRVLHDTVTTFTSDTPLAHVKAF